MDRAMQGGWTGPELNQGIVWSRQGQFIEIKPRPTELEGQLELWILMGSIG